MQKSRVAAQDFGIKSNPSYKYSCRMKRTRIKDGKTQILIFRKSFKDKSGKVVYCKGKAFPIWVDQ